MGSETGWKTKKSGITVKKNHAIFLGEFLLSFHLQTNLNAVELKCSSADVTIRSNRWAILVKLAADLVQLGRRALEVRKKEVACSTEYILNTLQSFSVTFPLVVPALETALSLKISTEEYLAVLLRHVDVLYRHCARPNVRKRRFCRFCVQQSVLSSIANELLRGREDVDTSVIESDRRRKIEAEKRR